MNFSEAISPPILKLIQLYEQGLKTQAKRHGAVVHADEIASKVARFYEKIRKITDWKEENVLRRNAIERILKRNLLAEISNFNTSIKVNTETIAEPLVLELVRGGHLANNTIPQDKIYQVTVVLNKYVHILKKAPAQQSTAPQNLKNKVNFFNWLIEIAACEIEETLAPPFKEDALIKAMTVQVGNRITVTPENSISVEDKMIQTYIATHRTLFDLDDAIIAYHLLQYHYEDWNDLDQKSLEKITQNISSLFKEIDKELKHPLSRDFLNICERIDTVFTILGDVLDHYKDTPEEIVATISDKNKFKQLITDLYNKRLATLKSRLFKLAIFSTLSVFISNWFTFFVVEVPLAHLFYEGFNLLAVAVDFIVPSLAMFLLVAIIKPPSPSNINQVIETLFNLIYNNEGQEVYEIKPKKKRHFINSFIINLLYVSVCIAVFGTIAWVFRIATIPISSVILDTLGIALNVFAALVIRNKAKELTIEEKTSFWEFIVDVISLPVAEIGSWLASKWREYNVVSVFLNVFFETPFVAFIGFLENWSQFLKEKKAGIH
ncbi:MAG: hypothetical protein ACOX50_04225 [Patescibacteria group bacterium]|jgi:hypothetical protein